MSDSLIQFPAVASGASFAGTCLIHTMIFTETVLSRATQNLSREKNRESVRLHGTALLPRPPFENQRGVGAAKAKRIRKRILDRRLARMIRDVVQIALGIWSLLVDSRRQNLIPQRT